MPDDLDELIRRSMKTLDDELPSGYFESLPDRTLARLEVSMQSGPTTQPERDPSTGVPPAREEDSGLHDIRSLAQSTKMRISKRVSTQPPPMSDSDMVAQTSGAWNAVALPEPARMVALPELDDLPSAKEVVAKDKAGHRPSGAVHPSAPARGSRKLLAVMGLSLAAAAGATIFVMTRESADKVAPSVAETTVQPIAPAAKPDVTPAPVGAPAAAPAQIAAPEPTAEEYKSADTTAPPTDTGAAATATPPPPPPKSVGHKGAAPKTVKKLEAKDKPPVGGETDKTKAPADTKKTKDDSDPSFDALLKEAGVDQNKKADKPKLDKKELSGDDFKKGIGAVAKKAQACYKGNQGTAVVKLTIAPSGSITKAAITGQFAGKPEGDCVQRAVQGASFPPWDGGPQTFTYSYLLSE